MKAVIFVDVQKDFIDGALRNERAIEVTPKIVEFAKNCIEDGVKLYATRDTHEKTEYEDAGTKVIFNEYGCVDRCEKIRGCPKSGYLATLEGEKLPVEHCIEGSDGWMIDDRLMDVLLSNCCFVNKPTFGSHDLVDILMEDCAIETMSAKEHGKSAQKDEFIIVGFCTDICVISNALLIRARFPNARVSVVEKLCAGTTQENHEAALKVMRSCQIDVI